jgi:hypothetical protein
MSDQFNNNVQRTIDRCRRLAAIIHDKEMAQQLLELAANLEANSPQSDSATPVSGRAAND